MVQTLPANWPQVFGEPESPLPPGPTSKNFRGPALSVRRKPGGQLAGLMSRKCKASIRSDLWAGPEDL